MIEKDKYIVSEKQPSTSNAQLETFQYAFRLYICKMNFDKFALEFKNIRKKPLCALVRKKVCDINDVVCANTGTKIGYIKNSDDINEHNEFGSTYVFLYDKSSPLLFKDLVSTWDSNKKTKN